MRTKAKSTDVLVQGENGFIIVAVLWILAALATLASIYAAYAINTSFAVRANDDRVQSEALVTAAIELTAFRLTATRQEEQPTGGTTAFRMGTARVNAKFQVENARIDLNAAPKELLSSLFVSLGAPPMNADEYAEHIIGWRSRSTTENADSDAELTAYRVAGRGYNPRRAPFVHVGELWLVLGLPPILVQRALPYLTVFNGQAQINVFEAAPAVIAALPGMTPDRLSAVLASRQAGADGSAELLQLLGPGQALATTQGSKAVRVSVAIAFDNGRRAGSDVVIRLLDGAAEPYRILSWRDDFDQAGSGGT